MYSCVYWMGRQAGNLNIEKERERGGFSKYDIRDSTSTRMPHTHIMHSIFAETEQFLGWIWVYTVHCSCYKTFTLNDINWKWHDMMVPVTYTHMQNRTVDHCYRVNRNVILGNCWPHIKPYPPHHLSPVNKIMLYYRVLTHSFHKLHVYGVCMYCVFAHLTLLSVIYRKLDAR